MSQIIIVLLSDEGELLAQISDKGTEDEGSDVYVNPIVGAAEGLLRYELPYLLGLMAAAYSRSYPFGFVDTPGKAGGYRLVLDDMEVHGQ